MSAQPQYSTIRPFTDADAALFLRWSGHVELRPQADALLDILGAHTAHTRYLPVILNRLSRAAPILSAWADEGVELFGMGRLAVGLADSPQFLSELSGRSEPPVSGIKGDFRGQAASHYLYMSWAVRDPMRPSARLGFDRLRCWLLVKSLTRAAAKPEHPLDDLISGVCKRLRMASEENVRTEWLDVIEKVTGPTSWFHLQAWFEQVGVAARVAAIPELNGDDLSFYMLLGRVAKDEAKAVKGAEGFSTAASLKTSLDFPRLPPPRTSVDGDDPQVAYEPLPLHDDAEEDEDLGVCLAPVDPTQSLAAQELAGRYIQLLSGADARFLAWDWYGLTPPETAALDRLIERSLGAAEGEAPHKAGLLASMVWVALHCGRSLGLVERLGLVESPAPPSDEWLVDLNRGALTRLPPRRVGHWSPNNEQAEHIQPVAESVHLALDSRVTYRLRQARAIAPAATNLGGLWPASASTNLRTGFRDWIATEPALRRITQGMLSQSLGHTAFANTDDHVLARLLASMPASGLPASTAYTAYLADQVPGSVFPRLAAAGVGNVAGSMLDPVADFLRTGFQQAFRAVAQAASGTSIIEYHNALTHYWDAVLRAATGIRPFAGRWVSFRDVDEQLQFVVIDDKPGITGSRTRLVPLPSGLLEQFRYSYLDSHVPALRQWLQRQLRGASGESALDPLAGCDFLFLLRMEGEAVVPTAVAQHDPSAKLTPEWPLPRRTYRHWLRTQLHRAHADVEVIDSMFGHQDGATATHGDYSMRVWRTDADEIRLSIDRVFGSLNIQIPPVPASFAHFRPLTLVRSPAQRPPGQQASAWAQEAVARSRWLLHLKAARQAAVMLTSQLPHSDPAPEGKRLTLAEIVSRLGAVADSEALDALGCRLVLTHKGMPATLGALRYGFLLRLIERAWEVSGIRPPLKRRFLFRPRDDSPFRHSAAGAVEFRKGLVNCFHGSVESLLPSKMTVRDAAWIAVIDLALSSRCTDRALHEVLLARRKFRLVRLKDQRWLEWNAAGQVGEVSHPVQRLQISPLCEHALAVLLSSQQAKLGAESRPPRLLGTFCKRLCAEEDASALSFNRFQSHLVDLTEQCNAIELPGLVAAQLAGRVRSSSLHWGDWLALRTRQRRDVRGVAVVYRDAAQQEASKNGSPLGLELSGPTETAAAAALLVARPGRFERGSGTALFSQQQARAFFKAARQELARERHASREAGQKGRQVAEASFRRDSRRRLEQLAAGWSGRVSTACWALVRWAASLMERSHGRALLHVSTVDRYFSALSPRFEATAADVDLLALDPEEIEDFYQAVVEVRDRSRRLYPAERLHDFHRFAVRELGLPAIDWSEIAPQEDRQLSSPGFVDEATFGQLLLSLSRALDLEPAERLGANVLVILAYRAGLRGSEVTGLAKDDLHLEDSIAWVSVEKNRLRELKSFSARRTVPMPHLRALELRLLKRMLADASQIARGHEGPHYFFADPLQQGALLDVGRIKRTVNAEIKWVSAQAHLSIHHLRHSFATRLSFELDPRLHFESDAAGQTVASWAKVNWAKSAARTRAVLGLTSDATRLSRRSAWVLCRLLGHAHPRTTFASYVHTLSDLAEHLAYSPAVGHWKGPRRGGGLDLEKLASAKTPDRHDRPAAQPLEAEHVLSMICDLDSGIPPGRLPARYPIGFAGSARLARLLAEAEQRLCAADQGSTDAEVRGDEDKASTVGPGRSRRKVPLARAGLMNHVLESHLPRLRPALALLYSERCSADLAAIAITEDEFVGMFGSRRNISMVRDAQFRLVAAVVSTLSIADSRLRLAMPADLRRGVAESAIASGWLQRGPGDSLLPARPGMRLMPEFKPDGILLDAERVHHRVVLSLGQGDGAMVQNRWEFALALMSTVPLLNFGPER